MKPLHQVLLVVLTGFVTIFVHFAVHALCKQILYPTRMVKLPEFGMKSKEGVYVYRNMYVKALQAESEEETIKRGILEALKAQSVQSNDGLEWTLMDAIESEEYLELIEKRVMGPHL